MADLSPGSAQPVGEKRKLLCTSPEKRAIKLRRFDVQTPVARQKSTAASTCASNSSSVLPSKSVLFPACSASKCLPEHAGKEHSSALDIELVENSSLPETNIVDSFYSASYMSGSKPSVSMLVRCSLEERRLNASISEGHSRTSEIDPERSSQGVQIQSLQTSIVDELFKEFIAAKMKEVSDGSNAKQMSNAAKNECGQLGTSKDSDPVAVSMEEISRLLDAEITSIQSRSTVLLQDGECETECENSSTEILIVSEHTSGLSAPEVRDAVEQTSVEMPAPETLLAYSDSQPCSDAGEDNEKSLTLPPFGCNLPPAQSSDGSALGSAGILEVCMPASSANMSTADISGDDSSAGIQNQKTDSKTVSLLGKKHQAKKLDISIRQESLALIMGTAKVTSDKNLEEGEVGSSSGAEEDALKTASQEEKEENESEDNEVSQTGSLSDTDDDKSAEKRSSKSKKKKKHKHKHKKKKKHKSQSRDKKDSDKRSPDKEEKSAKSKTKDGKIKNETEGTKEKKHSKDRRGSGSSKVSHSRSRSPSQGRKDGRSRSPRNSHRTRSHSRERRSKDRLDTWDARNYRDSNHSSQHSKRTQSRSRSRSQGRSYDRSRRRSRERSPDRRQNRSHGRQHSRDRNRSSHQREDQGEHSDDLRIKIDKNKLRKIAIANALANMESGQGPPVDISAIKCGGKSIAELTDFCKRISEREKEQKEGHLSDSASSDAEGHVSEPEDSLIHHPFKLRDPSTVPSIIMNIRNAKQLPVLTPQEKQAQAATLRTQFPVSSGAQHRTKESEWVPVTPTTAATGTTSTTTTSKPSTTAVLPEPVGVVQSMPVIPAPASPVEESVFQEVTQQSIDIGSIISERLQAVRKLQENPFDVQALSTIHKAQEKANQWAASKQLPGQFLGTTGVQCLTPQELAGPDKRNQAWARKDQFKMAAPVQGGIGMFLLQKMGWKHGEGLGKHSEGSKEPLLLDIKMDRKGLTTSQEVKKPPVPVPPRAKDLSGKHPVSALTELCTKRRWSLPNFELVHESGPDHKKTFLFKVTVNGVEYHSTTACGNKKQAKAQAAAVCLQEMGLIPRDAPINF